MELDDEGHAHVEPRHPGRLLNRVLLRNYKISVSDLSDRADLPEQNLINIIEGRADITPDVAMRLSRVFGAAANRLLSFQEDYNKFKTRTGANSGNKHRYNYG